jgi:hypothetical protein
MALLRQSIPGTGLSVLEERLSTLCKIYRDEEDHPFAQFYVQTGEIGQAVVKGLDGPSLRFSERRAIHEAMWSYLHNTMGYERATIQRVKFKPAFKVITKNKSLGRYTK